MSDGKIVSLHITRSMRQRTAVAALARCPECEAGEGLRVEFYRERDGMPDDARQTIWDIACPCGCEFQIVWECATECPKQPS